MTVVVGKEVGTWDVLDEIGRVVATCYEEWATTYFVEEDEESTPPSRGDAYESGYRDGLDAGREQPTMRVWLCTAPNRMALPKVTPVVVAADEMRARQLVEQALREESMWPTTYVLCEIELASEEVVILPQPAALRRITPEQR